MARTVDLVVKVNGTQKKTRNQPCYCHCIPVPNVLQLWSFIGDGHEPKRRETSDMYVSIYCFFGKYLFPIF